MVGEAVDLRARVRSSPGTVAGHTRDGPPSGVTPPPSGGFRGRLVRASVKIVTWLTLPVVICLSQRLSHACLSISNYTVKLRMAHYISHCLFDSTLLHGITVVILELIHAKSPDFGRGVFIR